MSHTNGTVAGNKQTAANARQAREVKPGYVGRRIRMHIREDEDLEKKFDDQSPAEKGKTWEMGLIVQEQLLSLLYEVLERLGVGSISHDVAADGKIALLVGDREYVAPTQLEALILLLREEVGDES